MKKQDAPRHEIGPFEAFAGGSLGLGLIVAAGFIFFLKDDAALAGASLTLGSIFVGGTVLFRPVVNRWLQTGGELGLGNARASLPAVADTSPAVGNSAGELGSSETETDLDPIIQSRGGEDEQPGGPSGEPSAIDALIREDRPLFESLMQKSIESSEGDERIRHKAFLFFGLEVLGDETAFLKLSQLSAEHPSSSWPLRQIGFSFVRAKEYEKAAEHFGLAADLPHISDAERVGLLEAEIDAYITNGSFDLAIGAVDRVGEMGGASAEAIKLALLRGRVRRAEGLHRLADECYESYLVSNPADSTARFQLAYSYAERNLMHLAIHHYALIGSRAEPMADNNLGVELFKFDLPLEGMRHFKRAAERDVTLAFSNIASHLLEKGFTDETKDWLSKARAKPHYAERVDHVASDMNKREAAERETYKELLEDAQTIREIYLNSMRVGEAILLSDILGSWDTAFESMEFRLNDGKIEASFKEEALWDWTFVGALEGRVLRFTWSNDRWLQPREGEGFIVLEPGGSFEGVLLGTPAEGKARIVTGKKKN